MEEPDDILLIRRCLNGDKQSFGKLVDKYKNLVFNLAYHLSNNYEDAVDITQEAFFNAYRNLARFQTKYRFSSWIYKITLNICRDRAKKKRLSAISIDAPIRLPNTDQISYEPADCSSSPENILDQHEREEAIHQAVESLPEEYRAPIILKYFQDMSYKEISKVTDLPITTIKTRLFRAREMLKEHLEPYFMRGE